MLVAGAARRRAAAGIRVPPEPLAWPRPRPLPVASHGGLRVIVRLGDSDRPDGRTVRQWQ
jgi:hypothetical protein